jgi:glycine hydroxymethyltransferase
MGVEEMKEIASIIKLVLSNTKPKVLTTGKNAGKPSKSKYDIEQPIINQAEQRVKDLLRQYPVYPELDIDFLMDTFNG